MNAFIKLGVIEPLAQALYQQGIRIPTVIQQASIPAIFKGKDIIGRSETGTGKTLAYLLPLVQRVDVKKRLFLTKRIRCLQQASEKI